jgi:hypothetical protein
MRFIRDNYGTSEWREMSSGAIHPAYRTWRPGRDYYANRAA